MQALIIGIVILWIGLDQALKLWTVANVPLNTVYPYQEFPSFMSLAHVINKGAAWSLFSGATPVLIVIRIIVGAGILVWLLRKPKSLLENVAFALIVAGAWGNAIDGLRYGHVVDMLQSHWLTAIYRIIQPGSTFPIFNIADTGVVGGVLLLVLASFLPTKKLESNQQTLNTKQTLEITAPPFEIQVLTIETQAESLLELQRASYQVEANLIGFAGIPALHETLEELQHCQESFYGFYTYGELAGAVSYKLIDNTLDIHRLVVHPNHFRQGIAKRLLEHLLAQHPDVEKTIVQTGSRNIPALQLYQRLGFTILGEITVAENLHITQLERRKPDILEV